MGNENSLSTTEPTGRQHIVINSNKWMSAVSEYALQLCYYLQSCSKIQVTCYAHSASPYLEKVKKAKIPCAEVALLPSGPLNFLKSFFFLKRKLKEKKKGVLWVFEGREHTLAAILLLLCPSLRLAWKLVRVRGQAKVVQGSYLNRVLYEHLTHAVVYAAEVVKQRTHLTPPRALVQPLALDIVRKDPSGQLARFQAFFPDWFDPTRTKFVAVARFDPVKDHRTLIESFCALEKLDSSLLCLGRSENIRVDELIRQVQGHGGRQIKQEKAWSLLELPGNRTVVFVDERMFNLYQILQQASCGVICSLDSEVICRVAVEMMQVGLPIISTRVGALPEILGKGCFVSYYEGGNTLQLTKSMKNFVEEGNMEVKRKEAKQQGAKFTRSRFQFLVNKIEEEK